MLQQLKLTALRPIMTHVSDARLSHKISKSSATLQVEMEMEVGMMVGECSIAYDTGWMQLDTKIKTAKILSCRIRYHSSSSWCHNAIVDTLIVRL